MEKKNVPCSCSNYSYCLIRLQGLLCDVEHDPFAIAVSCIGSYTVLIQPLAAR